MAVVSAYFGVLILVYCTFQLVDCSCSSCSCCGEISQQCMQQCTDPNDCTKCVEMREDCEAQYCKKRSPEEWKPKARPNPVLIPDQNGELPLSGKRELTLKYLLRDILARREKNGHH
ncbi:hypothetical protein OS493_015271 [Desmophyllum pertusum]|uniref:Uncharacterized protein n=1 Tax=Desmophyllum pertusum TaxID=174260 RepID=A0A9W9ZD55_9CNID|nr:hypothetical protein OS493_015271 [Desmophyllum pertusum]